MLFDIDGHPLFPARAGGVVDDASQVVEDIDELRFYRIEVGRGSLARPLHRDTTVAALLNCSMLQVG